MGPLVWLAGALLVSPWTSAALAGPTLRPQSAPSHGPDCPDNSTTTATLLVDGPPASPLSDKADLERPKFRLMSRLSSLGSGLLAAAVPLAALVLPSGASSSTPGSRRRAPALVAAPAPAMEPPEESGPVRPNNAGLHARVDYMMGWLERSVEHLPSFPRLHPQECVKRSICEAHHEPDKHGAVGFLLRLLFPASDLGPGAMDNMEYKVINKYRHAAGFGLGRRLDTNNTSPSACKDKYEDCLVSLLDVARNLLDMFLK